MDIPEFALDQAFLRHIADRLSTHDVLGWLDSEAERLAEFGFTVGQGVRFTKALQRARNIYYIAAGSVIGEHACIVAGPHGYVIHFNENIPAERRRFAIAHEIGHTFFFDTREPGEPISNLPMTASTAATVENLCDFFARALLLPRARIKQAVGNLAQGGVPPLHLIPTLAREYEVAEQAVARRLLYQIFPSKVAALRLRRSSSCSETNVAKWRVSWCAIPWELRRSDSVAGIRIPFRTAGREIPDDMIPTVQPDGTETCKVDGRWWQGLTAQSKKASLRPFKARAAAPKSDAFVCKTNLPLQGSLYGKMDVEEVMYLAIPL